MEPSYPGAAPGVPHPQVPIVKERYWLHILLFVATVASTTVTWILWSPTATDWPSFFQGPELKTGFLFACSLLGFLTVHEFGHYFAARYHKINASLPYFIPLPLLAIGTLGAVISIRQPLPDKKRLLDVGAAGPIAGFVAALVLMIVAFATMPGPEVVLEYEGHDELKEYVSQYGTWPDIMPEGQEGSPIIGNTILFWVMTQLFDGTPPPYELYHNPLLFAAWLALFFTALNLLPVGQLDGGHVTYALFGAKWHARIARAFVLLLLLSATIGIVNGSEIALQEYLAENGLLVWLIITTVLFLFVRRIFPENPLHQIASLMGIVGIAAISPKLGAFSTHFGYSGWLVWSLLLVLVIKIDHPPVFRPGELSPGRKAVAVLCLVLLVLCFSVRPFYIV